MNSQGGGKIRVLCDGREEEQELVAEKSNVITINLQYGYHYVNICNVSACNIELLWIECRTVEDGDFNEYNFCKFIGKDTVTNGDWKLRYGTSGYDIYGYKREIAHYIKLIYCDFIDRTWVMPDEYDMGQALNCENGKKVVACKCFGDKASIDIVIAGKDTHTLTFYIMDCYNFDRVIKISAIDADSLEVLDMQTVNVIRRGIYVK